MMWDPNGHWADRTFYGAVIILAPVLWFSAPDISHALWSMVVLLGFVASYVFVGRKALNGDDASRLTAYSCLVVALAFGMFAVSPAGGLFLFIAYPQIWMASRSFRRGVGWNLALTVSSALGLIAGNGWDETNRTEFFVSFSLGFAFSMFMGSWMTYVIKHGAEQERLRRLLEDAQDELAQANRTEGADIERARMAREIHDTLAQGFTSIVLLAQSAQTELAPSGTSETLAYQRLLQIEDTARENLAEARSLVTAFTSPSLHDADLPDAVARLAAQLESGHGVRTEVAVDGSWGKVEPRDEVTILRCVQEGIANIRKHSSASNAWIALRQSGSTLTVSIRDDGVGFVPAWGGEGFGLAGMRERIAQAHGTFDVDSAPGNGTNLTVTLPYAPTLSTKDEELS